MDAEKDDDDDDGDRRDAQSQYRKRRIMKSASMCYYYIFLYFTNRSFLALRNRHLVHVIHQYYSFGLPLKFDGHWSLSGILVLVRGLQLKLHITPDVHYLAIIFLDDCISLAVMIN